ncbi:DUF3224 domain-containing protein [Sciscionella sediminilitoris]|uniref:DUF3224 domain-containing protein n=1 Tax=Sciscionella sediminilitoris TaxID=1445613 RepID=UPI0004DF0A20|nr:DUF3224 domain-containing protein [Sciscionella sp. SE31]
MTDFTAQTIQAEFDIENWEEVPYHEPEDGPRLTRITIRKNYRGTLEGTGLVEVLTAQGNLGSGYVASELIRASLDGRSGTFVIQHGGLADNGAQNTFGTVVPHSGTGELTGLRGEATEATMGVLTLTYYFDTQQDFADWQR